MLETRQRVRIGFRKAADLRMISHRDLARLWERLFRRAGVQLGMSEGYHPKAKMSFPSALALGIQGDDEVLEVEMVGPVTADALVRQLLPHLPPGLSINRAQVLAPGEPKAQARRLSYAMPVPPARQAEARAAVEKLRCQSSYFVEREGRDEPIDLRAGLDHLELSAGTIRFTLLATQTAGARPREVLAAIGLADLLDEGFYLTRTAVETAVQTEPKRLPSHEKGNAD